MAELLSDNVAHAIAEDVFTGSVDLSATSYREGEDNVYYEIQGIEVNVRKDYADGGGALTAGYHLSTFFGGVVFALHEQDRIPTTYVSPENIAKVCVHLGLLAAQDVGERS